jgi:cytochrome c peroxidase
MQLPAAAPPDPSNAHADDPKAAALGEKLFFSSLLTPSERGVSCNGCHQPELLFQDGRDQPSAGVASGVRNVPNIALTPEQRWQFWDGRADVSWGQAVVPFEDATEFASSRLFVVHAVAAHYASDYQTVFGALPDLSDGKRFPPEGKPGDASWQAMQPEDQRAVNRVFANLGKALSAYERRLRPAPNGLDRYAAGDRTALTDQEKQGLSAFMTSGCVQCHYGPRLTDDSFHVLGFATGRYDRKADPGRLPILDKLAGLEFSKYGAYSDDPGAAPPKLDARPSLLGAFKTPGLRGVSFTLPYGHGGTFGGLVSVIEAHRAASLPQGSSLSAGEREAWLVPFDAQRIPDIIAFLKAVRLELPK